MKKRSKELVKGYTCQKCGAFNAFDAYVFAHWQDVLTHTCACGTRHRIKYGQAIPAEKPLVEALEEATKACQAERGKT